MELTKDTLIADILRGYPQSLPVFKKYRMGCTSCSGIVNETLRMGCLAHGVSVEDVLAEILTAGTTPNSI
jgi:hybrid cluster-associated redox disulfide protein